MCSSDLASRGAWDDVAHCNPKRDETMPEALTLSSLPLFPLGAVLFPGGVLPLRIFEVRYLDMLRSSLKIAPPKPSWLRRMKLSHWLEKPAGLASTLG